MVQSFHELLDPVELCGGSCGRVRSGAVFSDILRTFFKLLGKLDRVGWVQDSIHRTMQSHILAVHCCGRGLVRSLELTALVSPFLSPVKHRQRAVQVSFSFLHEWLLPWLNF